jgi:hypothetical protein
MIRELSACVFVLLGAAALGADETEQLDADFLEYLAHLEGDDDDWTLVAQSEQPQSQSDEDTDRKAEKAPKQADRPAVDER